ncbi:MAG: ATP-binding protein [candidate division WOR-3 bacterium]|nr:ATP-binding protein [candidate division WOR-3 bacterium]
MADRRIITVLSGKGGTGKTTVASALAMTMENAYYIDSDVEEPNGKFFMKPNINDSYTFKNPVPRIDENKCTFCGKCADGCEYSAISIIKNSKKSFVFDELCHSCGLCWTICPENAIDQFPKPVGDVNKGIADTCSTESFKEGLLNIGLPSGVPLINHLLEDLDDNRTYIIDAPPGTSCPVVAALMPCDFALIVTEPTPFGINDLELTLELIRDIGRKGGIVINKFRNENREIKKLSEEYSMPILATIPYERSIAEDYSDGVLNSRVTDAVSDIIGRIQ